MNAQISSFFIYPIKSCGGIQLSQAKILPTGLQFDRQWMLVDPEGNFLTLRKYPKMGLIQTQVDDEGMTLGIGKQFFRVSYKNSSQRKMKVKIWNDEVEAALEPQLFSDLVSQFLGVKCFLVRALPEHQRVTLFADRRPILLVNKSSAEAVYKRAQEKGLSESLDNFIARFRPNIVVEGVPAFEENHRDEWIFGSLKFSDPKPCTRCPVIELNSNTYEKDFPLLQLLKSDFPKECVTADGKITFGVHLTPA